MKPIELKDEQKPEEIIENKETVEKETKEIENEEKNEEKEEDKEEVKVEEQESKEEEKVESHPQVKKEEKLRSQKQSKKEPRIKKEKEINESSLKEKKEISVKEIEEEISKETKEIEKEAESILSNKDKKNNILEHKETFSLEGTKKNQNNSSPSTNNTKNESQSKNMSKPDFGSAYPPNQMFYMYNPMMMPQMPQMDSKGQMTPQIIYYPIYYDPTKMSKDMNGQNMGMFYSPMMYPPNFTEQNFMTNNGDKK